nr:PREDICTED: GDNF family receptor alpha-2 [Latimeria chalumnae]|eukprot:XP_005995296.1 PREDICTED: GDNF family receptor alpha-2 [Latimeria chalumnae]
MIFANILCILLFVEEILHSLAGHSSLSGPGGHDWRTPVDCVKANEQCGADSTCSSRYRTLRQCLAGKDRNTLLTNKECQAALEVLQESPLYGCRCKRGMKKELQCLQIYWSIHLGLTDGEEFYEASPYEPVTFRLASIVSVMDLNSSKENHCLDAAKACNLDENCMNLRSQYISTCTRLVTSTDSCNRRKCHKALRQFFDRIPSEYTYRLLFCSCRTEACAQRRRQTIVPSCSYEDKEKLNCLVLRRLCRYDHLCRSRLADFHKNCQMTFQTRTQCPNDNYQACLSSYSGLIGFDITPNYIDANISSITISPWCTCKGSGNGEEDCERFLKDFRENRCLKNAIQAFDNGIYVNVSPKKPSVPETEPPNNSQKTQESTKATIDSNSDNVSVPPTCINIQEKGPKFNMSKEHIFCLPQTDIPMLPSDHSGQESNSPFNEKSHSNRIHSTSALLAISFLTLKLVL